MIKKTRHQTLRKSLSSGVIALAILGIIRLLARQNPNYCAAHAAHEKRKRIVRSGKLAEDPVHCEPVSP